MRFCCCLFVFADSVKKEKKQNVTPIDRFGAAFVYLDILSWQSKYIISGTKWQTHHVYRLV